ncbi:hypothetical protein L9F63_014801, partial [Diploptera punctata]
VDDSLMKCSAVIGLMNKTSSAENTSESKKTRVNQERLDSKVKRVQNTRIMAKRTDSCNSCSPPDFQAQLLNALRDKNIVTFTNLLQEYDADGERLVNPDHQYGDPHYATCLDLACKDQDSENYITTLLKSGADPNLINPIRKKAPLHVATECGNFIAVSALLQEPKTDVNIQDDFGSTSLHLAAKNYTKNPANMEKCIAILLGHPDIKINKRNRKGRTAVHEAVLAKRWKAVEVIINYGKDKVFIDNIDLQSEKTVRELIQQEEELRNLDLPPPKHQDDEGEEIDANELFEVLYFGDLEKFKQKFDRADKKSLINGDDGKFTFLQFACYNGIVDIVKYLLTNGANPNSTIPTNRKPPIFHACARGFYEILLLLLESKAEVETIDGKTLLHAVVKGKEFKPNEKSDYRKCVELLLERKDSLKLEINYVDENGNTALHYAVKEEDQYYTKALLASGAYIGVENHFGYSPLADIDPETLRSFLDDCLQSNGKFRRDDKYELTFKYGFLEPPRIDEKCTQTQSVVEQGHGGKITAPIPELYPLHYISKSPDLRPLLTHPILLSYLHLKWTHIRAFFYANLVFYALFVVLITAHIMRDCSSISESSQNISSTILGDNSKTAVRIEWAILSFLLLFLILRELFQMIMSPRRYLCSFENCLELVLIIVTLIILSKDWNNQCMRPVDAIAIILSWSELFLQIGHIHIMSTYNEMMRRVFCNYIKFIVWDLILIIAFALGFYILFYSEKKDGEEENFFHEPSTTLFRTVIMLMGEFDISSIPFDIEPVVSYAVFIFFVFLVPIVMVNLLNGLAVSDTQAIKNDAELVSIESMIGNIYYFESMLLGDPFSCSCPLRLNYVCCCWPSYARPKLTCITNLFRKVFLFPNSLPNKELRFYPNLGRKIRIFPSTVYTKKKQNYDQVGQVDCFGLPAVGGCCNMDASVIKSAMDIIDNKDKVSEKQVMERLDSIEKQVQNLQRSLNGWFSQSPEE